MVKKRTIQQKSEDESKGVLLTLFKDWIVNPLNTDFGFDFEVRLTAPIDKKTQEVSEISFYVQNKSSIKSEGDKAIEDLAIDDWILFLGQRNPVLITKYDLFKKQFYWEIAQDYLWDTIERKDQNWRRRKYKRIRLTKKITNLDEIKTAIITSQKRITRYHSLNLGIGEGIRIDREELSRLTKTTEKMLDEFKYLSLWKSCYARKKGDLQTAHNSLMDVYTSPKADEAKVRAIIGIIFELNIAYLKENEQIIKLAEEAISLCEKLNLTYLKAFATILRNRAILYVIVKKMTEVQFGLKVQETLGDQSFSFFYNQEYIKLFNFHQKLINEINSSLLSLLLNKKIYYYLAALSILIDVFTTQVASFTIFNREIIKEEQKLRKTFIEQCEFALGTISNIDLKKVLLRSLANYYYWTLENEKAVEHISTAIDLGKEDCDKFFVEENSKLREKMEKKQNPYDIPKIKNIDDMTVEEYQEMTENLLEVQGIKLSCEDELTKAISMALRDINPKEYFQHCKNLHICYLNTSILGRSIGLPSMGTKLVWCKHCKCSITGFDLKGTFNSFKRENCQSCVHNEPRSKKWICYVKWVKKQEKHPDFKKVLTNLKRNF